VELSKGQLKERVIGIDASNLRRGGGVTHLVEIITALSSVENTSLRVVIWGCKETLDKIAEYTWLIKRTPNELSKGFIIRAIWQRFKLPREAISEGCDLIFAPGGSFSCSFRPIVTMSRNMLPFEWCEARRYGFSLVTLRLILLRWLQLKSFRSANGVIFLTKYAETKVLSVAKDLSGITSIIPHGLSSRFCQKPKKQLDIVQYSDENPFNIVYVSIIDQYKHQWNVVEAVAQLRKEGYPVILHFVGPSYPAAQKKLTYALNKFDKNNDWVRCHGEVPYEELHHIYKASHLGIFASSCENMPNILLETMAAGLPIACSNRGPMPEIMGSSGEYFDPEIPVEIYNVLQHLINNPVLRLKNANNSFCRGQQYSWSDCSAKTFAFLERIIVDYKK